MHDIGRNCWCNPWIVRAGEPLLAPFSCNIVAQEPLLEQPPGMLFHVDRDEEEPA